MVDSVEPADSCPTCGAPVPDRSTPSAAHEHTRHVIAVAGFTDPFGLDLTRLQCTCGWRSDDLDSGYFTLQELNRRATEHVIGTASHWPR